MFKRISNNIIFYAVTAIAIFWVINAAIDYYLYFDESLTYVLFEAKKELSFRLFVTVFLLIFSITLSKLSPAKKALLASEERYRSLVENTDDSIYVVDRHCRYLFINKIHLFRLKVGENQYIGRLYREFNTPEDTKWFEKIINNIVESGVSTQHEYKSTKDGKYFALTFSPIKTKGQVTAVTIISKEITKIKSMEEKLYTLSITDELTGLYNRRGFFTLAGHQLKSSKRYDKRIFLLYADLDNMKEINDTLGHAVGDVALVNFANILRSTYRESDVIARLGGDEFVVYPVGTTEDNAGIIGARLQLNIEEYNAIGENKFNLSVSIGVVPCDSESSQTLDELLAQADKLMYEIKKQKYKSHVQSVIID